MQPLTDGDWKSKRTTAAVALFLRGTTRIVTLSRTFSLTMGAPENLVTHPWPLRVNSRSFTSNEQRSLVLESDRLMGKKRNKPSGGAVGVLNEPCCVNAVQPQQKGKNRQPRGREGAEGRETATAQKHPAPVGKCWAKRQRPLPEQPKCSSGQVKYLELRRLFRGT